MGQEPNDPRREPLPSEERPKYYEVGDPCPCKDKEIEDGTILHCSSLKDGIKRVDKIVRLD